MIRAGMKSDASAPAALPISTHTPAPYDGPSRDEVLAMRRQYPHARPDHLLPRALADRRRATCSTSGTRPASSTSTPSPGSSRSRSATVIPKIVEKVREQVGRLQHTTTIYLHPTIGAVRQEAGRAHARGERPVGQLLHQFRQRGQRDRRSCRRASSPATPM